MSFQVLAPTQPRLQGLVALARLRQTQGDQTHSDHSTSLLVCIMAFKWLDWLSGKEGEKAPRAPWLDVIRYFANISLVRLGLDFLEKLKKIWRLLKAQCSHQIRFIQKPRLTVQPPFEPHLDGLSSCWHMLRDMEPACRSEGTGKDLKRAKVFLLKTQ